jgi:hypothetical protein
MCHATIARERVRDASFPERGCGHYLKARSAVVEPATAYL